MHKKLSLGLFIGVFMSLNYSYAQWTDVCVFNQPVEDFKVYHDTLFMGGNFLSRDNIPCDWSCSYDGNIFINNHQNIGGMGIKNLEVFNGLLYCTGPMQFVSPSYSVGVGKRLFSAGWFGAGEFTVSHTGIFADGEDLYVGSNKGVVSKKTSLDSFVPLPAFNTESQIWDLTKYNNQLIAAGIIGTYNGDSLHNIARFDGTNWQPLGLGVQGYIRDVVVYNNELYVCGAFGKAGGQSIRNIAKWNGTTWSSVGGSLTGSSYSGIRNMIVYNSKLYITGDFVEMGGIPANKVAQWDGSNWTAINLDVSGVGNSLEVYKDYLYVSVWDSPNPNHLYRRSLLEPLDIQNNPISNSFVLYPNPVTDILYLENLTQAKNVSIDIMDMNGKQVTTISIQNKDNITEIDINGLRAGTYYLSIRNANNEVIETKKIIKS